MIKTSFVFASGFLEFIDRLHDIIFVVYNGDGKVSITSLTSALLISNFTFFSRISQHSLKRAICLSKLKPSDVYETNDLLLKEEIIHILKLRVHS